MVDLKIDVRTREGGIRVLICKRGDNLRKRLLRENLSPHQGLSCSGMGVCGTCAVKLVGSDRSAIQRSCQIRCFRNLKIELLS